MTKQERKYKVLVGEIGKEVLTPLKVTFQTSDPDFMEYLLQLFPQWLGYGTIEEKQCQHLHGGPTCSCQRQCQRPAGHKGNHYYAWGKAGREKWAEELEKSKHE